MLHYKTITALKWVEADNTAVHLYNRSMNSGLPTMTPSGAGFKRKPRLDHLRVFGLVRVAHANDAKHTKQDSKGFKCMFLGFIENTKWYPVYDLETRSLKQDEREVNDIYDSTRVRNNVVIQMTKDVEDRAQRPTVAEPVNPVEKPIEGIKMSETEQQEQRDQTLVHTVDYQRPLNDTMVFHPEPERLR
ncbi:LOW QUALITY PROTEIN: Rve-domain-containing hypothetical protein [Phytophthora megakarya]|uniref:Retroviral polymerase SH3-like domain-containing protein n=1 Tax=Phytophthora megakarya TaxID=4795 RepID=A0A225WGL5_9STRA|nr:LOW QUALITY PROTEIN: Rve-domain-containing hypothetical protein [Phytophthora megakarya]